MPYDFTKLFDVNALLEFQRKNILAFSEAQHLACEALQGVARRQAELFSQTVEESSLLVRQIMAEGTVEEKMARHTDLIRKNCETSLANWHELAGMITDSGKLASDIINHRVTASLTELKPTQDKIDGSAKTGAQKKAA